MAWSGSHHNEAANRRAREPCGQSRGAFEAGGAVSEATRDEPAFGRSNDQVPVIESFRWLSPAGNLGLRRSKHASSSPLHPIAQSTR